MAKSGYLYRRPSGIYVVRICVPRRLKAAVGRGEIHVSTGARDPANAKAAAFRLLLEWQQRVLELDRMDVLKVVEGSPLFGGEGFLLVQDAARALGLDTNPLLVEALNSKCSLWCVANAWEGIEVAEIGEVERDWHDGFVLNSAEAVGHRVAVSGNLILFDTGQAVRALVQGEQYPGEVFFRDEKRRRALLLEREQPVGVDNVMLQKLDVERIRLRLASSVTPKMIEDAKERLTAHGADTGHKYGAMRSSELMARFLDEKKVDWKPDHQQRMARACGAFVELMGDPVLASIDRPLVMKYRNQLRRLPRDPYQARRKYGCSTFTELIAVAERTGCPTMELGSANLYVRKLSEMLGWGVENELVLRNSAARVGASRKRDQREQDDRALFADGELGAIFSAEWFQTGRGKQTARGRIHFFQPHFYWLPLLGLYAGGRLNELSQLYLDDVQSDQSGGWFLDFNLNGQDKLDLDPSEDGTERGGDKSLKTVNSQRIVAIHQRLIELGFLDYVAALRAAGHRRLFPELRFDSKKGYGAAPGSWFNERFLGRGLGIARDGTKTFHSLRHMFITGLFDKEVPEATINQLSGHARGETQSGKRYRKDQAARQLKPYVDRLAYNLPSIAPFDVSAGLEALECALERKERNVRTKSQTDKL